MKMTFKERLDYKGVTSTQAEPDKPVGLEIYVPDVIRDDGRLRPGILILPGGGYAFCSVTEAEPIALSFVAKGYIAAVLYYRTQGMNTTRYQAPMIPDVLTDVLWALETLRQEHVAYHMDPDALGLIGFSAGAHLAAMTAFGGYRALVDRALPYPVPKLRFLVLAYPVILSEGPHVHMGSFRNLWSESSVTPSQQAASDPLAAMTSAAPPTFVWTTADDPSVPVHNTLALCTALATHNVPFACRIYPTGPHGLALAHTATGVQDPSIAMWITECQRWTDEQVGWNA